RPSMASGHVGRRGSRDPVRVHRAHLGMGALADRCHRRIPSWRGLVSDHSLAARALAADAERPLASHEVGFIAAVARMTVDGTVTRLLIVSRDAKGVTPVAQRKLDAAFPRYEQIDF